MLKFYILLVANFLFYLDMKLLLGLSYQNHTKRMKVYEEQMRELLLSQL